MKIIYPPLVEQSLRYHGNDELVQESQRAEMYRAMVAKGIITENGLPTEVALSKGWVKDFFEEEDLSFEEFLSIYPYFQTFKAEVFQKIDGFWEIPVNFKEKLLSKLKDPTLDYDERMQIEEYLSER